MKQSGRQRYIVPLAALLLLAVFSVSILLVLLEGASVYRRITDRDRETWQARSAYGYLVTKLRQEDREGALAVEELAGLPALTLGVGEEYQTRLYCYDGFLWELYAPAGLSLAPEDGEKITELRELELSLSDGTLQAVLTQEDGQSQSLVFTPRSGEVGS